MALGFSLKQSRNFSKIMILYVLLLLTPNREFRVNNVLLSNNRETVLRVIFEIRPRALP